MVLKILIAFIAVLSTVFFINYKYTKGIRIIAYQEEETVKEAWFQMFVMAIIIISWTIYLSLY